jgi:hypothetical protein
MTSWFNLYKREQTFIHREEINNFESILRRQGYKFDKRSWTFYKNEIPDIEIKKLEKYKKIVVYDDETFKILSDAEINELDEIRNCSLYPSTIIVEEDPKRPQNYEPVQVIEKKKKRGRKLRLPLSNAMRKEVLEVNEYRCSICYYISESNQIHHVDGDPSNNQLENLVVYCYECHKKLHSRKI